MSKVLVVLNNIVLAPKYMGHDKTGRNAADPLPVNSTARMIKLQVHDHKRLR